MRMAKTLLLLLTLCTAAATRADDLRADGTWWNTLSTSDKISYIVGFEQGLQKANADSDWILSTSLLNGKLGKGENDVQRVAKVQSEIESMHSGYFKYTFKQLIDGLDQIYSDYRNARIPVLLAIEVVDESMSGSSDAWVERRLQVLRKEAAQR